MQIFRFIFQMFMVSLVSLFFSHSVFALEGAGSDEKTDNALIEARRVTDKEGSQDSLTLVSHKPNYFLVGYYHTPPQTKPFESNFPNVDIDIYPLEIKAQLSIKTMLANDLIGDTGILWIGYTNRSFWQAFNSKRSSPFRETNHEPEAWIDIASDRRIGNAQYKGVNLGISHQSNGQWGEVSRSWNRVYSMFMFQKGNNFFAFKPWLRLPEKRNDDDNPDIEKYMGSFEFYLMKEWEGHTLGVMLRNNLRFSADNHGALQVSYTFPLHNQLRGYVQGFSGYGESLIDYDHEVNTIGIGLMLSNWL